MNEPMIPIVFATDDNYVPYCGVAISSLIQNAYKANTIEIFVLYDRLSLTSIRRLESLTTESAQVSCICIHDYIMDLNVAEYNHVTIASAYRLVIPDVLPQYDKLLYLDSDIVVNGDISELYSFELGDNILGAVHGYFKPGDFMHNHITKTLKIQEKNFFNAGILLINAEAFRRNHVKDKCFQLLSQRRDLYYMDQCALNIVCEGSVFFLPSRWNYEWLLDFSKEMDTEGFRNEGKAIIHYDSNIKPWDFPGKLLADVFWSYARRTIFYEEILYTGQRKQTRQLLNILGLAGSHRNIAIYGAGNAGKKYVETILSLKICNIVLWVDKNYADKTDCPLPVECVDRLYETEYEQLIIAVEDIFVSNDIKSMLISNGIDKKKIVQIC